MSLHLFEEIPEYIYRSCCSGAEYLHLNESGGHYLSLKAHFFTDLGLIDQTHLN